MIDKDALANMPLEELRELHRETDQQINDRRCYSSLQMGPYCTAEAPHADGWHESRLHYGSVAHPAHTAVPHPVVVRWRFDDDVVAQEHEHEARRRPGAN